MNEAVTRPDVVVDVDGSDESFAALKWALEEAPLTGQSVNTVFGWTHSWDMGSEPGSDEAWAKVRHGIANELRVWADKTAAGIDSDPVNLKLTSVKVSGTSALPQIGHDSQQIAVGRRSLSRMARWSMGSLSISLAEAAGVPVAVVRIASSKDETVTKVVASALILGDKPVHYTQLQLVVEEARRLVAVGVNGSEIFRHAFDLALEEARLHDVPLHVMLCWQFKNLGVIPGHENAMASVKVGQRHAEETLSELMAKARIPNGAEVSTSAFHIPVSKDLIAAPRYASHLVVGSCGLSGPDVHFPGSVSCQIVNFAKCTVTVVY